MLTLRSYVQVGMTGTIPPKKIIVAKLQMDSAEDLPSSINVFPGMILFQGSTSWDISTGKFYAMTSDGQWYEQGEE